MAFRDVNNLIHSRNDTDFDKPTRNKDDIVKSDNVIIDDTQLFR